MLNAWIHDNNSNQHLKYNQWQTDSTVLKSQYGNCYLNCYKYNIYGVISYNLFYVNRVAILILYFQLDWCHGTMWLINSCVHTVWRQAKDSACGKLELIMPKQVIQRLKPLGGRPRDPIWAKFTAISERPQNSHQKGRSAKGIMLLIFFINTYLQLGLNLKQGHWH